MTEVPRLDRPWGQRELRSYSHVPYKRTGTLIFSKQIRLFWQVLTPISRCMFNAIYGNVTIFGNVTKHGL